MAEELTLKEALANILDGLQSEKQWREAGEGFKRLRDVVPNVVESLTRGGVGQAIGTSGDLREVRDLTHSFLPKSIQNFTHAAEFLANPYAKMITQTTPTTEQTLQDIPRITDTYEGYKQHETLGEYIAPSLGYFGGKAAKAYGNYVGPTAYKAVEDYMVKSGGILPMETWHGSKSSFDEFDPKKVGSSSGIDYGHGLYSAEHPEIAKGFGQNLYKLDIPDEHIPKMIDWYSTEQPPEVTKILKEAGLPYKATGEQITLAAAEKMGGSDETKSGFQKAAEYLHSLGIKGNKYENFQIKKGQGADTYNYVSYDPTEVKILEKNGQKLASDIDELGFHSPLENAILKIQQPKGTGDQFLKQLEKTPGVKTEELDVTGVKQYLQDNPTVTKQGLLDHLSESRLKLENKVLGESTTGDVDEYQLRGGEVYHDQDYIDSMADDLHYDMKNDPVIRDQERQALLEADPERYADYNTNPYSQARLEEDIDGVLYENAKQQANDMYYENPIRHYYDDLDYAIYGNDDMGYSFKDPSGGYLELNQNGIYDIGDAEQALREYHFETGNLDYGNGVKYEDYTLPGKYTNYREVLTTLPQKRSLSMMDAAERHYETFFRKGGEPSWNELDKSKQEDIIQHLPQQANFSGETYTSGHFDEPNILAHTRLNDRIINGKKTLMVEEIQSDWHQAGRKKGYASQKSREENADIQQKMGYLQKDKNELREEYKQALIKNPIFADPRIEELSTKIADIEKQQMVLAEKLNKLGDVPDAPFKKNWHELMMKQILNEAVKGDYDAIAFTTGKQQAARYSLSKQIDSVDLIPSKEGDKQYVMQAWKDGKNVIRKAVNEDELPDLIGKEAAKKLLEQEPTGLHRPEGVAHGNPNVFEGRELKGLDLDVGGEGMKGFYDKILPDFVNKYTKKWGMGVKKANLEHPTGVFKQDEIEKILKDNNLSREEFNQLPVKEKNKIWEFAGKGEEVHLIDLSDMAKKEIKGKGQPMFSGIGLAVPGLMMEDQDKTKK